MNSIMRQAISLSLNMDSTACRISDIKSSARITITVFPLGSFTLRNANVGNISVRGYYGAKMVLKREVTKDSPLALMRIVLDFSERTEYICQPPKFCRYIIRVFVFLIFRDWHHRQHTRRAFHPPCTPRPCQRQNRNDRIFPSAL